MFKQEQTWSRLGTNHRKSPECPKIRLVDSEATSRVQAGQTWLNIFDFFFISSGSAIGWVLVASGFSASWLKHRVTRCSSTREAGCRQLSCCWSLLRLAFGGMAPSLHNKKGSKVVRGAIRATGEDFLCISLLARNTGIGNCGVFQGTVDEFAGTGQDVPLAGKGLKAFTVNPRSLVRP